MWEFYKCYGIIICIHLKVMKEHYHRHNKFIKLFLILSSFNVLEESCSFVDWICPLAGSISHICFGCLWCSLPRVSRNERDEQFIPSWLWNLDQTETKIVLSNCIKKYNYNYGINSNNNNSVTKQSWFNADSLQNFQLTMETA